MIFNFKYERSIDPKQRLPIPAEIREGLDPEADGEAFYIIEGPNGALWLWPERTFERLAGDIEPSLVPSWELMDFDEITFPEARRLRFDSAGRIRIPKEMLDRAGIGARVVILGMRNHLELRDPEEWERRRQEKAARRTEIVQRARAAVRDRGRGGEDVTGVS